MGDRALSLRIGRSNDLELGVENYTEIPDLPYRKNTENTDFLVYRSFRYGIIPYQKNRYDSDIRFPILRYRGIPNLRYTGIRNRQYIPMLRYTVVYRLLITYINIYI